jgi:hypothetical protein
LQPHVGSNVETRLSEWVAAKLDKTEVVPEIKRIVKRDIRPKGSELAPLRGIAS